MSNRAAKQARRAKRKAKQAARDDARLHCCIDCGIGPLWRGGIVFGGPAGERHYCKACMPPERAIAIVESWGKPVYRAVIPDDVEQVDTGGRT